MLLNRSLEGTHHVNGIMVPPCELKEVLGHQVIICIHFVFIH
jgi:hypothetical protein